MKLSELLDCEIESVKLETDPNGHIRVLFSDEELKRINDHLKSQLDTAYEDWTPIWNESIENLETYRTVKIAVPDGGQSIYPAPIARIPADQIIASVFNAVMRPRPVFSIDAYLSATYDMPQSPLGQPGQPPSAATVEQQTSEKVAHRMEQGYDFIARERIQIAQKLLKGIRGAVIGSPYWWKVVADPQQHTTMGARSDGAIIDLNDKYEETRLRGDIVKWYLVPFTNGMMPLDADSIDEADWFGERKPMRPDDLGKRYASNELFLITDDAHAANLVSSTIDSADQFRARSDASTQRKVPSVPIQVCDNWLTWFYWNVRYIDPKQQQQSLDGKKVWSIKRLSLLGDFHRTDGSLMTCWLNPYEHLSRPYELVDQMDDNDCTVSRLKYHQTMFTYAAQSEIKNAHTANHIGWWHDPNVAEVADFFANHRTIGSDDHIPGVKDKEWGTYRAGEDHYSLLELLKFYLNMSQLDSRENDFTMGGRPPGRTPSSTVAQVYKHAEETKTMLLARLSLKLSRLLRLDAETRRQYQPLGEVLPVWEQASRTTIEIPFRFPVGDVLDNFRMALTAADEVLTEERDPQQVMMRKQALMADGEYVAKVVAAILNLSSPIPQSGVELFAKILMRDQQLMRSLMGQMVTDEENYDLTAEIKALIQERNQVLQQMQSQPPQQQQPQQQVKISLSGQLTPEQEAQAAAAVGIGGMNAQSTSGPQQAAPGPAAGQAGTGPGAGAAPVQRPVPPTAPQAPAPLPGAVHPAAVQ